MKALRLLAVLFLLSLSNAICAQWVSIPDNYFANFLDTTGYHSCLQGNNAIGWQLDTTCNAVVTAVKLDCHHKQILDLTGIQYFDNLDTLDCHYSGLSFIPPLPPVLRWIDCSEQNPFWGSQVDSLPPLPLTLTYLDCRDNVIDALPPLPPGLVSLKCGINKLMQLPTLPASLEYLDAAHLCYPLPYRQGRGYVK